MTKRCFRTAYNYDSEKDTTRTKFTLPSETVPDQSYTIRELLLKFTSGVMPPVSKNVHYEDEDFDQYSPTNDLDFDLADATAMKYDLDQNRKRFEKDFAEKQKLKKDQAKKDKEEFEKWKKANSDKKTPAEPEVKGQKKADVKKPQE